jgi:hypothetical protein
MPVRRAALVAAVQRSRQSHAALAAREAAAWRRHYRQWVLLIRPMLVIPVAKAAAILS